MLLAQLAKLGISEVLDSHIKAHGLRQGLSVGQVATFWLSYILSQGDHRKSQLEPWAATHLGTLSLCLQAEVRPLDFSTTMSSYGCADEYSSATAKIAPTCY